MPVQKMKEDSALRNQVSVLCGQRQVDVTEAGMAASSLQLRRLQMMKLCGISGVLTPGPVSILG